MNTINRILILATICYSAASGQDTKSEKTRITFPEVSEQACPATVVSIPGKAGNQIPAVVRQPPGSGPFPAIVLLHGGLSPIPLEALQQESLTRPITRGFSNRR